MIFIQFFYFEKYRVGLDLFTSVFLGVKILTSGYTLYNYVTSMIGQIRREWSNRKWLDLSLSLFPYWFVLTHCYRIVLSFVQMVKWSKDVQKFNGMTYNGLPSSCIQLDENNNWIKTPFEGNCIQESEIAFLVIWAVTYLWLAICGILICCFLAKEEKDEEEETGTADILIGNTEI